MSEEKNKTENLESEPLLEKVRELEKSNQNQESGGEQSSTQNNTAKILNEKRELSAQMPDDAAKKIVSNRARRSFLIGGAAAVAGIFGWKLMSDEQKSALLNRSFKFNENLSQSLYSSGSLAPEFPVAQAQDPRVNGLIGMSENFDPQSWRLQVLGVANARNYSQFTENIAYETAKNQDIFQGLGQPISPKDEKTNPTENVSKQPENSPVENNATPGLLLTLDDIKTLPRVEMTTQLKCIEGWSVVVNWAGARFSDFVKKFQPEFGKYVSLITTDGGYYVGWDMQSILHPQTLLAYEMNGQPLALPHGAPLRIVTTMKYGIKQIKRIGRIEFTNTRPADYWAERGYDWYSGH